MKTRSEYIALSEDYLEGAKRADEPSGVAYHHQCALIYAALALAAPPEPTSDPTAEELAAALGREMAKTAELLEVIRESERRVSALYPEIMAAPEIVQQVLNQLRHKWLLISAEGKTNG